MHTHQTAPTQLVEAAGIRFAYRRFANRHIGAKIDISLLVFMHFTGTMDHWDPAVTDGFAQDREVILFDNAGVSSSSGEVPTSIEELAQHLAAFIEAFGVKKLDGVLVEHWDVIEDEVSKKESKSGRPMFGEDLSK